MKIRATFLMWAMLCTGGLNSFGQTLTHVKIEISDAPGLAGRLIDEGFDVLNGSVAENSFEVIVTEAEMALLGDRGLNPQVIAVSRPFREIQAERQADQESGAIGISAVPTGYKDLSAILAEMNTAATNYPGICEFVDLTAKYSQPTTWEGRHMYAVKISDNVTVDEDEPVQLVVCAHHAREIVTPVIGLYAIEQLTEGYGIDPTITALVDEYEIWIAPVWNPDGYNHVFEVNNMWRKNRRRNAHDPNTWGVDQNRNYPFGWETSCGGSTTMTSLTYKGPSPASEPETQTMIAWTEDQRFAKVLDFHSYGQYTICGYQGCWTHPFLDFWAAEAAVISTASGYGGSVSRGSTYGEHFMWQQAYMGAHSFLTEVSYMFQPTYPEAVTETLQVYPSIIAQLQRSIPLSGHVTDVDTGLPLVAEVSFPEAYFDGPNANASGSRFGRYHVFLPAGEHTVRFSADGYYSQNHVINITAATAQTLEVELVAKPLIIDLVKGPNEIESPGSTPDVRISIAGNTENYVPGTATVFYRYDDGVFTSMPMVSEGGGQASKSLPAVAWGDRGEVYFSAEGDGGGIVFFPDDAPTEVFSFEVGLQISLFTDNFETDKGWSAENLGASTGDWQRGVPVNDPGWAYDPVSDGDGSGACYLTQNETGNTDVDAGAVRLTSPSLDMSEGRITISYDYYLRLNRAGDGTDHLLVEIDSNGGAGPWIAIADHVTDGGLAWRRHEINEAILRELGIILTNTMRIRFTANDADTQSIVEAGIDGFSIGAVYLWPLDLRLVEGPSGLLGPGTEPKVVVEIKSTIHNYAAGMGKLWYRYDDGAFTSIALTSAGGDLYNATLPAVDWGDKGEFYFSAQSDQGVTAMLPEYAPDEVFTFEVGVKRTAFSDNFEDDKGWTAENLGASSGDWQRGVPINNPDWPYDPISDSDGSGQCWLTENLKNSEYKDPNNTDVDQGAVRLISPGIDMSYGEISIRYDYFLRLTEGGQGTDHLLVEIDPNDGNGPLIKIADHTTNGGLDWRRQEIDADTLKGLGIDLTTTTRLRFTANDATTQSIVEAGIDAILISSTAMTRPGDMDGDNDVDLFDYVRFAAFWMKSGCGLCGGADRAGNDGKVGPADLYMLGQNWLKGK